jgi:hypothetical protein
MKEFIEYMLVTSTAGLLLLTLVAWVNVLFKLFPSVEGIVRRFDLSSETRVGEEDMWTALKDARTVTSWLLCSVAILFLFEAFLR